MQSAASVSQLERLHEELGRIIEQRRLAEAAEKQIQNAREEHEAELADLRNAQHLEIQKAETALASKIAKANLDRDQAIEKAAQTCDGQVSTAKLDHAVLTRSIKTKHVEEEASIQSRQAAVMKDLAIKLEDIESCVERSEEYDLAIATTIDANDKAMTHGTDRSAHVLLPKGISVWQDQLVTISCRYCDANADVHKTFFKGVPGANQHVRVRHGKARSLGKVGPGIEHLKVVYVTGEYLERLKKKELEIPVKVEIVTKIIDDSKNSALVTRKTTPEKMITLPNVGCSDDDDEVPLIKLSASTKLLKAFMQFPEPRRASEGENIVVSPRRRELKNDSKVRQPTVDKKKDPKEPGSPSRAGIREPDSQRPSITTGVITSGSFDSSTKPARDAKIDRPSHNQKRPTTVPSADRSRPATPAVGPFHSPLKASHPSKASGNDKTRDPDSRPAGEGDTSEFPDRPGSSSFLALLDRYPTLIYRKNYHPERTLAHSYHHITCYYCNGNLDENHEFFMGELGLLKHVREAHDRAASTDDARWRVKHPLADVDIVAMLQDRRPPRGGVPGLPAQRPSGSHAQRGHAHTRLHRDDRKRGSDGAHEERRDARRARHQ